MPAQLWWANGEVAPFVRHKAFLPWFTMQDPSFVDLADNVQNQWSEVNVSEDLDLALRLFLNGYTLRWATYSLGGFKEGVLTAVDELARWQKVCCWFLSFWLADCGMNRLQREYLQPSHHVVAKRSPSFKGLCGPSHHCNTQSEWCPVNPRSSLFCLVPLIGICFYP